MEQSFGVSERRGTRFRRTSFGPHLGGDLKVVRVNDAVTLARYHEYHTEFETKSYQELYAKAP